MSFPSKYLPEGGPLGRNTLYLQIVTFFAPAWGFGGPVRLMYDYAQWMSARCAAQVLTCDSHHDLSEIPEKQELIGNVIVKRFRTWIRSMAARRIFLVSPRLLWDAFWTIWKWQGIVLLHVCETRGACVLYGLILKLIFPSKIRLIHSGFGMLHHKPSMLRDFYDTLFMGVYIRQLDVALAQNDHEAATYLDLFERYNASSQERIHIVPLHADLPHEIEILLSAGTKDATQVRNLRAKYHLNPEAVVLLFLGRIHPAKGIIRAIDTFREFEKICSKPCVLLLVGRDDGFQQHAEEYIARLGLGDRVRIQNNVYESRYEYYYLSDCFVGFPTIFEETMLASVEALRCGTPVLVSKEADIPYVDGKAGAVIEFSPQRGAEELKRIVQQIGNYQQSAIKIGHDFFSSSTISKKFISIVNPNPPV